MSLEMGLGAVAIIDARHGAVVIAVVEGFHERLAVNQAVLYG